MPATTNPVLELGEHLGRERTEKVTLEATSDYWRIWFYLLEAAGRRCSWSGRRMSSRPRAIVAAVVG